MKFCPTTKILLVYSSLTYVMTSQQKPMAKRRSDESNTYKTTIGNEKGLKKPMRRFEKEPLENIIFLKHYRPLYVNFEDIKQVFYRIIFHSNQKISLRAPFLDTIIKPTKDQNSKQHQGRYSPTNEEECLRCCLLF